jgi:hypothetical protein
MHLSINAQLVLAGLQEILALAETASNGGGAINWWAAGGGIPAIQVLQAIGAADLATSLVDLSGNGNDAVASGSASLPGWNASDGWVYAGPTKAIMTGILPAPDWSFIGRFSGFSTGSYLIGGGPPHYIINPDQDGSNARVFWGAGSNAVSPNINSGVIAVAGHTVYYNGIAVGTIPDGTDSGGFQVAIGCLNFNGADSPVGSCDGTIQATAFYAGTLSDAQVLAKSLALAAI